MALIGHAVTEEQIFEIVDGRRTDGQTDDGQMPDNGHPISSPCEPNGSGELKKPYSKLFSGIKFLFVNQFSKFLWHYLRLLECKMVTW